MLGLDVLSATWQLTYLPKNSFYFCHPSMCSLSSGTGLSSLVYRETDDIHQDVVVQALKAPATMPSKRQVLTSLHERRAYGQETDC